MLQSRRKNFVALGCAIALCVLSPIFLWLSIQSGKEPISGLRVRGTQLPSSDRVLVRTLREQASIWEQAELTVSISGVPGQVRVARSDLGASLPVERLRSEIIKTGRSGNPVVDLKKWWLSRRGGLNLRWDPEIQSEPIERFVEMMVRRAEVSPIAGVTDGQGYTLPGQDGRAMNPETAKVILKRALMTDALLVTLPVQPVPAPPPIMLGSPDGALFEGTQEESAPQPTEPFLPSAPVANAPWVEPRAWLPANDNDCYDQPPKRRFCDGPRKVPAPFGPAAELAKEVGLGQLETVGLLTRGPPKPAWVRAAGSPPKDSRIAWPVPQGRLGRGFGYVRRPELRDRIHAGVDIVAAPGSQVRAVATGIVAYSDNHVRGYGNLLVIIHADGAVTFNAHCQRIFVFAGERVTEGQVVAEVGTTGLSMGPHLHFEYHVAGAPQDPLPQFTGATMPASTKH